MARSVVYLVDGFNVYHSLRELGQICGQQVKWLDLRRLLENYSSKLRDQFHDRVDIGEIRYFSALAEHLTTTDRDVVNRHLAYISALESTSVEVILSRFKRKDVKCPHCGNSYARYEEKETDVAIAVGLIEAFTKGADGAVIVSGDSDLAPGIKAARTLFPHKKIGVAFPFARRSTELQQLADFTFFLQQRDIQRAQFPTEVELPGGGTVTKPNRW